MKKVIPIDLTDPDSSVLSHVAGVIRGGGLVAVPTDTFYGLAANPFDPEAVRRIFETKGRDPSKPILLLIGGLNMLDPLVREVPLLAQRLIERFWPGPLTLVLKASDRIPDLLTAGTGKIGIRFPKAEFPVRLIDAVGGPITATSANVSGEPSPTSAADVERMLGRAIDLIVDGGPCSTVPSTVLDLTTPSLDVLREGMISVEMLEAAIAGD